LFDIISAKRTDQAVGNAKKSRQEKYKIGQAGTWRSLLVIDGSFIRVSTNPPWPDPGVNCPAVRDLQTRQTSRLACAIS
jgi:hypothetical protein